MAEQQKAACAIKLNYLGKLIAELKNLLNEENFSRNNAFLRFQDIEKSFNKMIELIEILSESEGREPFSTEWGEIRNDYYRIAAIIEDLKGLNQSRTNQTLLGMNPMANSTFTETQRQLKLPIAELPKFDGDHNSWLSFKNSFRTIIHARTDISEVVKLTYLRNSLTGEALRKVKIFDLSNENYHRAWKILTDSYEHKRILVSKHLDSLLDLNLPSVVNAKDISKLVDDAKQHLGILESLDVLEFERVIVRIIERILPLSVKQKWEESLNLDELPNQEKFFSFLSRTSAQMLNMEIDTKRGRHEIRSAVKQSSGAQNGGAFKMRKGIDGTRVLVASINNLCLACKQNHHPLYRCEVFSNFPVSKRWHFAKEHRLCFNCLRLHSGKCQSTHCRRCDKFHNTMLHSESHTTTGMKPEPTNTPADKPPALVKGKESPTVLSCFATSQLLMTVRMHMRSSSGKFLEGRALLDTGATHNFVSEGFVKRLNLQIRRDERHISGFGDQPSRSLGTAQIFVRSRFHNFSCNLHCVVVPHIAETIPSEAFPRDLLEMPKGIKLADPSFHEPNPIDLIVCSSVSLSCLAIGRIHLSGNEYDVYLQKTQFGWVTVGGLDKTFDGISSCNLVNLNSQLKLFWEIQDCSEKSKPSSENDACEAHYVQNVTRDPSGRYVVRLPFKRQQINPGKRSHL